MPRAISILITGLRILVMALCKEDINGLFVHFFLDVNPRII